MRKRRTYRKYHVGRLRIRAAKLLAEAFPDWDIQPEDIHPVTGFWLRVDVYRWEVWGNTKRYYQSGDRIRFHAGCGESLTRFVKNAKNGIVLDDGELWARTKPE